MHLAPLVKYAYIVSGRIRIQPADIQLQLLRIRPNEQDSRAQGLGFSYECLQAHPGTAARASYTPMHSQCILIGRNVFLKVFQHVEYNTTCTVYTQETRKCLLHALQVPHGRMHPHCWQGVILERRRKAKGEHAETPTSVMQLGNFSVASCSMHTQTHHARWTAGKTLAHPVEPLSLSLKMHLQRYIPACIIRYIGLWMDMLVLNCC